MNKEVNSNKDNCYYIDEYDPWGNFKVIVPGKWWQSETSYCPASAINKTNIKVNKTRIHSPKTLFFPGWDIKNGDYKVEISDKKSYRKIYKVKSFILGFVITLIVLVLTVLYVSIGIGNSIYSDFKIK